MPHEPKEKTAMSTALIYTLQPKGSLDLGERRITTHTGEEVQKVQPHGCPANGLMGMCFVQHAATGEFIGQVCESSLQPTGRRRVPRDLAAEARDRRHPRGGRPAEDGPEYTVTWTIDLNATSPRAAAEAALEIHRDRQSSATVFDVRAIGEEATTRVDLADPDDTHTFTEGAHQ
jgi:hypothetical protein